MYASHKELSTDAISAVKLQRFCIYNWVFNNAYFYFQICFNWAGFYDPESGISKFMVGVGTSPGLTDVVRLTRQGGKQYSACLLLNNDNHLKHGNTYYGVVWAFNGAVNQRNTSGVSDGGK